MCQPSINEAVTHRENKVRMIKSYGQNAYGLMQYEMQRMHMIMKTKMIMRMQMMMRTRQAIQATL